MEIAEEEPDAIALAATVDIPDNVEISDVAISYWLAWHRLTSDRPIGMMGGAGRIPYTSIVRYAEVNLFEDADQLADMLWAMDGVYFEWLAERAKSKKQRDQQ